MSQPTNTQTEKTTANEPVSEIDPGGARPGPTKGQPKPRPEVQSGDQNTEPPHGTDR